MSLSSEEVNFLVYRYMLESGFIHSAYAFGHESLIVKSNIDGSAVPPGALVSFIQKGLQYMEMEAHVNDDGTETVCDEEFSVLEPHSCSVKTKRKIFDPYEPMEEEFGPLEASYLRINQLKGHSDMVTCCKFHPTKAILASGAGEGEIRLWNVPRIEPAPRGSRGSKKQANDEDDDAKNKKNTPKVTESSKVLTVAPPKSSSAQDDAAAESKRPENQLVVSVGWNSSGTKLACGMYDGRVCVWENASGKLLHTLKKHSGPVSCVKWAKSGELLVSVGVDKGVIVWDGASGELKQQVSAHSAAVLDADWRDDGTFATCASDGTVCICAASEAEPVKRLKGHRADVNSVCWNSSGSMLATCSDDCTVKVWNLSSLEAVHTFDESDREVCALAWGRGREGRNLVASGSLDCLIRIWTTSDGGKGVMTIDRHAHPVTSLEFSPNGKLLASASYDRLHVFVVKTGSLLVTHKNIGSINDLSWDSTSQKIAASLTDGTLVVLDIAPDANDPKIESSTTSK